MKISDVSRFKSWHSKRMGHPLGVILGIDAVSELESEVERLGLNYDRLTEENKQQRESLDAFRELVKAQTKTIHDLNEENTALQRENSDLKDKTLKLTTTMYQLRDYLSDIEYDLDQADSVFTLKDEIALIDETLTIRKE